MEIQIKKGFDAIQTETVLHLLSQTVWACGRKKEAIMESWKHSVCYGAYTTDGKQIGFARVITDYATQYYICDVVVDADFRHKGVVLCQEKVQIKHAFFKVGLPCQSFCFFV